MNHIILVILRFLYVSTSIDKSNSSAVDDFPCPLKSMATTLALSLILLADKANESLHKQIKRDKQPHLRMVLRRGVQTSTEIMTTD